MLSADISTLTQSDQIYQKTILEAVSRTFALTIPLLPTNLEIVIGNTYLLCRIIDTIEDAICIPLEQKNELSNLFLATVLHGSTPDIFIQKATALLEEHTHPAELDLIQNTSTILRIFASFSEDQKEAIGRCVKIMSLGMQQYHMKQSIDGLQDLQELSHYCYVVAGVVGELLTTLFKLQSIDFGRSIDGRESLAIGFGQALQMTNILKDAQEDLQRGVVWLPRGVDQQVLYGTVYQCLCQAMTYITLVPKKEIGIRRFCFLAFGLAVITLENLVSNQMNSALIERKLSRRQVGYFYVLTKFIVYSDSLIRLFFRLQSRSLRTLIKPTSKVL